MIHFKFINMITMLEVINSVQLHFICPPNSHRTYPTAVPQFSLGLYSKQHNNYHANKIEIMESHESPSKVESLFWYSESRMPSNAVQCVL